MNHIALPKDDPERLRRLKEEMGSILKFTTLVKRAASGFSQKHDRDTPPPSHVSVIRAALREDEISEGDQTQAILSNAKRTVDGHFVVLKP